MGADNDLGNAAKEYVSGFTAGLATVITGHPFDTVKVDQYRLYLTKLIFSSKQD